MLSFFSGLVVAASGAAGLWYYSPRNGQIHPFIVMPVLDWLLPVGLVSALALGATMMVAGVLA